MKRGWAAALAVGVILLGASGCASAHPETQRLRLIDLPIVSGGDEHDEIGVSDNGEWWVIGRYPSNRVVLVNIRTGKVSDVAGRRQSGAPYAVTDDAKVEAPGTAVSYPNLDLDRTDAGDQLSVVGSSVLLTIDGGKSRKIATGYPRSADPELATPFSAGMISGDDTITIPTTLAYDNSDRNHAVDIYQLNVRSGGAVWVSRAHPPDGVSAAASASGRFVVYVGKRGEALRWDRNTGRTAVVSLADNGNPGRQGVSGEFSVTDTGVVAFVSNDCTLTSAPPPSGAQSCLYVSTPA
jgi:hypothetical protein